jgi:hypothetical protein
MLCNCNTYFYVFFGKAEIGEQGGKRAFRAQTGKPAGRRDCRRGTTYAPGERGGWALSGAEMAFARLLQTAVELSERAVFVCLVLLINLADMYQSRWCNPVVGDVCLISSYNF